MYDTIKSSIYRHKNPNEHVETITELQKICESLIAALSRG
jgi:hypothetical protein